MAYVIPVGGHNTSHKCADSNCFSLTCLWTSDFLGLNSDVRILLAKSCLILKLNHHTESDYYAVTIDLWSI